MASVSALASKWRVGGLPAKQMKLLLSELKKPESIIRTQGLLPLILVEDGFAREPVQHCHSNLNN